MMLKKYLRITGLTQADFARMLGVTQQNISKYILGKSIPRPALMKKIVRKTGGQVTLEDVFFVKRNGNHK